MPNLQPILTIRGGFILLNSASLLYMVAVAYKLEYLEITSVVTLTHLTCAHLTAELADGNKGLV